MTFYHYPEIPSSPTYFHVVDKEYYTNFSLVVLLWNTTNDLTRIRVDYFKLQAEVDGVLATEYNYTKDVTMAIISDLPYNANITFLLTAHNCIGESVPVSIAYNTGNNFKSSLDANKCFLIFHTVRCGDINSSSLTVNSSYSQTLGSTVLLLCVSYPLSTMVIECQKDGSWRPDPTNAMCGNGKVYTSKLLFRLHELWYNLVCYELHMRFVSEFVGEMKLVSTSHCNMFHKWDYLIYILVPFRK